MNNASKTSITSRTLTAAMLVMGMSFGSAAALVPATADAAAAADNRFNVAVGSAKGVKVGKAHKVKVELTAASPWYMNTDFPTGLKVKASGAIKLSKAKFKKTDASPLSKKKIVFTVEFTPTKAGSATISGDLKFAICRKESCSPVKTKVSIPVSAK